jgi:hypothetical protein
LQADPSPVASDFALTAPVALLEPAALPAFPQPGVDPLTAPLAVVVGDESPTLGAETVDETWQPGGRVADLAWPCIRCGERNPMEAEACQSCAAPFGAGLATGAIKATERRRRNLRTAVIVGLALLLLAAITYFTTKRPPAENVDSRLPSEAPADPGVGEPLP